MFELNRLADGIEKLRAENEQLKDENERMKTAINDALDIAESEENNMKMQPWDFLAEAINDESTNQD